MHAYAEHEFAGERTADETDVQFFYKTRKKTWGPFKQATWDLPADVQGALGRRCRTKFEFLMQQLKANNTREFVLQHVFHQPVEVEPPVLSATS